MAIWNHRALELWQEEVKNGDDHIWCRVADRLKAELPNEDGINRHKVRDAVKETREYKGMKPSQALQSNLVQGSTNIPTDLLTLLNKSLTLSQISNSLKVSERVVAAMIDDLRDKGYNIELNRNGLYTLSKTFDETVCNVIESNWQGEKIIRFGLMGDTQINSKYTQLTHLHKLYDFYESEGIHTVYHTGDIDEGEDMRKGHKYECYNQGADDHVDEIIKVYPGRKGIKTKFITGNHDHSLIKAAGYDIGKPIAMARDDMEYLGQSNALIYLTPNCTLELNHPGDGTAYAISYKIQKMVEAISGGEKPNILAVGHYHKSEYLFYRNVHCVQTGCLQAQTPWMRGKSIAAMMGGWLIEAYVNDEGNITRLKQEWFPFYRAIPNDHKNFQ